VKNQHNPSQLLRFGLFELDAGAGTLSKNGRRIPLQPQPLRVLGFLASRGGRLITREELKHEIWNGTTFVDFEQGLNFCIRQIRIALDENADSPRFLETVPRRGYRFIAECKIVSQDASPEPPERNSLLVRATKEMGARRRYTQAAYVAGSLAFVLVVWIGIILSRRNHPHMPDPSTWVRLTHYTDSATSPALSPDGRMLAFIRGPDTFAGPGQVYVKLLPEGEPVQLTHDSLLKMSPVFSLDGSRIAYTVAIKWETWEVPTMGGEARLMLANASGLIWKDPRHLFFSEIQSGRHMGVASSTDSRTDEHWIYMPRDGSGMAHRSALSPDGRYLLIAEMDTIHGWLPCRLLPSDGSSEGRSIGILGSHCTSATWSPDGRWMYFSSDSEGSFHIWRQRFPDGKPEQVTSGPLEEEGVVFAPDGHSFVTSAGMAEGTIWLHDLNGERQISSEGFAEAPSLSRDGRKLFYLLRLHGRGHFSAGLPPVDDELWQTDLSTGQSKALLPGSAVTAFSVEPDEHRIAYSALDAQGMSHVWLAGVTRAKPPEQIPFYSSQSEDLPIFATNGDLLFRASEGSANYVYRLPHAGDKATKVTEEPIVEPQSVSPNSRWVVTQVAFPGKQTPRGVVAYPMQGGTPIHLCQMLCFVNWTADGKSLFVHLPGTTQFNELGKTYVIPIRGQKTFPPLPNAGIRSEGDLLRVPGTTVIEGMISPGPDARRYTFAKQSVHRNLYRIPAP
jgi:eukaryotic-like serine/threonine-protein kinase